MKVECKKCGCTNISATWVDEIKDGTKIMGIRIKPRDEHLLRECLHCGYKWKDKTLDNREKDFTDELHKCIERS